MTVKPLLWITRVLTLLMVVVSVLPVIPSGQWWIRLWEFPLLEQEVKHLVSERRPSIFATLDVPGSGP